MFDYQLFDSKRIKELVEQENESLSRKRDLTNAIRVRLPPLV